MTKFDEAKFMENYPEDYKAASEYSLGTDFENFPFEQKLYNWINGLKSVPKTECGKPRKFVSLKHGYNMFCGFQCACMKRHNKEKREKTCLEKYGVSNYAKTGECRLKTVKTNMERYGVKCATKLKSAQDKKKTTCLKKYGKEYAQQSDAVKAKIKRTNIERRGVSAPAKSREILDKMKRTNMERYGVENVFQHGEIREKFIKKNYELYGSGYHINTEKTRRTNLERYGVEWACMRKEARTHSNNSGPNKAFEESLQTAGIKYEREFPLENYSYDFKVGDTLIEINPTATHNSFVNIFGKEPLDREYHLKKSITAHKHGYTCLHVWDWDNIPEIIESLKPKTVLYTENLDLHVAADKTNTSAETVYSLYFKGEPALSMLFEAAGQTGGRRWKLSGFYTHKSYDIVNGPEKLFNYFAEENNPESVIYECGCSEYDKHLYERIGFTGIYYSEPVLHWYNMKTKRHVLPDTGCDNEVMIKNGFLPVYDAGYMTLIYQRIQLCSNPCAQ